MKKIIMCFVFCVLCSAALILPSLAIPGQMNYQGVLKDSSGDPLTGSYSMVFAVYDAASGGTSVWTETQTVSVEAGLYNIQLGSSTALTTSIFDGNTRYLGVKVGSDAEMTPRVVLVTVPYAYRASYADQVSGGTGSYVIFGTTEAQTTTLRYGLNVKTNRAAAGAGSYYAVYGNASGEGSRIGVYGRAHGSLGKGVYGSADTGTAVEGNTDTGTGIMGIAWNNGACSNKGGDFIALGEAAKAVSGLASKTGNFTNYGGWFSAAGDQARAVYGETSGSDAYGGYFKADGADGTAVEGVATSNGTDDLNCAGRFLTYGGAGWGVKGLAWHTTGANCGVLGESKSPAGVGVYGMNLSTGNNGIAVFVHDIMYLKPRETGLPSGPARPGLMCFYNGKLWIHGVSTWEEVGSYVP